MLKIAWDAHKYEKHITLTDWAAALWGFDGRFGYTRNKSTNNTIWGQNILCTKVPYSKTQAMRMRTRVSFVVLRDE